MVKYHYLKEYFSSFNTTKKHKKNSNNYFKLLILENLLLLWIIDINSNFLYLYLLKHLILSSDKKF